MQTCKLSLADCLWNPGLGPLPVVSYLFHVRPARWSPGVSRAPYWPGLPTPVGPGGSCPQAHAGPRGPSLHCLRRTEVLCEVQGVVTPGASGRLSKDLVGDDEEHPVLLVETTSQSPAQYSKATGTCLQNRRAAETLGRAARGAHRFQTPAGPGPPSLPHELPSVPQEPGSGLPLPQESALHLPPPLGAPGPLAELRLPARSLPTELSADSPIPAGSNLASLGAPCSQAPTSGARQLRGRPSP